MRHEFDIIGVGESGVDLMYTVSRIPGRGEKTRAKHAGTFAGGMIGNFCAAAAKQGMKCGVVTAVGNDSNGRFLLDDYESMGIDTQNAIVDETDSTFYCLIFIEPDGEKRLLTVDTKLNSPPIGLIDQDYPKKAKYVHLNSMDYTLASFVTSALQWSDTKVSLDYEAHAECAGLEQWKEIFAKTNVLFLNEESAVSLLGSDYHVNIVKLNALGPEVVVITCGEQGGFISSDGIITKYKAAKAAQVADTTGAGDCFNASFLSRYIEGETISYAAEYAAASAALSVEKIGARTGQPTRDETLNALRQQKGG